MLSGGQDSTTCLYRTIRRFGRGRISSLTIDHGQRHRVELDCGADVARQAGVRNQIWPIDTLAAPGGNARTAHEIAVAGGADGSLPSTFVPGRNLVFLTFAAAQPAAAVVDAWPGGRAGAVRCVVCAGGELLLQLDRQLLDALRDRGVVLRIGANVTMAASRGFDWICISSWVTRLRCRPGATSSSSSIRRQSTARSRIGARCWPSNTGSSSR